MKKFVKALACALSIACVLSFAAADAYEIPSDYVNEANNVIYLVGDESKGENGPFNDNVADLTKYVAVKFTIALDEAEASDCANGGETWVGGGAGFNSESTGWESHEWTPKALDENGNPVKELTLTKVSDGVYEVTFAREDGSSIFAETDTYAQIWIQDWSTGNAVLKGATLYTADGADEPADTPADDTPADDTPADGAPAKDNTPSTGDATSIVLLSVVAIIALGGVVVSSKKRA